MTQTVYEIITGLQAAKGTKAKSAILLENAGNIELNSYLRAVFEPTVNYYIAKMKFEETPEGDVANLGSWLNLMDKLASREVTGNEARNYLQGVYNALNNEQRVLLKLLINRNIKAGVAAGSINKVMPGLIREVPYQRCLSGEWGIECEDGIHRTIKQIVEEKYTGGVKSFDQTTGRVCFSPVVGHFDNGMTDDWIIIEYEENGERHFTKALTPQHKVFLADGQEVEAGSLKPGQALFSF